MNTSTAARHAVRLTGVLLTSAFSTVALATNVILMTPLGDIEIELFDDEAPGTVENFLNYVRDGDYADSFIHRSVPGFVIQGGGFTFIDGVADQVPADDPITNEPGISNVRGTIAMAKLGGDPDSATSQWYINIGDNSADLDDQNGGFTVFGQVVGDGMQVVDEINLLPIWSAGPPFETLPLIDYPGSGAVTSEHLVFAAATEVEDFLINAGLNDAWLNPDTVGQGVLIIVFPQTGQVFLAMFTYDTERPDDGVTARLGEPGHRWFTAQGPFAGNRAELEVFFTSGGVFDAPQPVPETEPGGTAVLEFEDCRTGTLSYDIPSIQAQGVIPLERIVEDNVALCESLQPE